MEVTWREISKNAKLSKKQRGTLNLSKMGSIAENDADLPKNKYVGLSQFEFIDAILSIASTKYGEKCDYQFECIHKLVSDHLDSRIYQNIMCNDANAMSVNEDNKKSIRSSIQCLRKLFKLYAALDTDDKADDN